MGLSYYKKTFYGIEIGTSKKLLSVLKERYLLSEEHKNEEYVKEQWSCKHVDEKYKEKYCGLCGKRVGLMKEPNGGEMKTLYRIVEIGVGEPLIKGIIAEGLGKYAPGEEKKEMKLRDVLFFNYKRMISWLEDLFDSNNGTLEEKRVTINDERVYICKDLEFYEVQEPVYYLEMDILFELNDGALSCFKEKIELARKIDLGPIQFFNLSYLS
ncbi:MAG: hypothetical protein Hyperionvirus6_66 [Hyperionvirus sp.]|uniref:Uncharacterized protein n=1 Tax=Hyperionvirus sp. TaxID=2487770 RepID=A0A3G5A818_9VIRU|nr:MAG: hypothetical protein Hyperionvirus6_66 [Hyperionvirus sp.]